MNFAIYRGGLTWYHLEMNWVWTMKLKEMNFAILEN